jgi:hypothetical protein
VCGFPVLIRYGIPEHFKCEMLWRRKREAPPPAHEGVGEIYFRRPRRVERLKRNLLWVKGMKIRRKKAFLFLGAGPMLAETVSFGLFFAHTHTHTHTHTHNINSVP